MNRTVQGFVLCLKNTGYAASLEPRKIYATIQDIEAEQHDCIRVIDESGEDYLYPNDFFTAIDLPKGAEEAFLLAS